jgi:hypothetical protein
VLMTDSDVDDVSVGDDDVKYCNDHTVAVLLLTAILVFCGLNLNVVKHNLVECPFKPPVLQIYLHLIYKSNDFCTIIVGG